MNASQREKAVTRTSLIGIGANVFLAAFKAFVGLLSGSIAIVLDAVNNLTDALSSVITIVGMKLSRRRPDHNHPFGYGRIEYISTIVIALLVLFAGGTSIIESVKKIFAPEIPDFSAVTVIIVAASVIIKFLMGRYVKSQGEKYNSDALVASGIDAGFDALISVATLAGAVITMIFGISLDGILAAVISLFIVKAGAETLLEALSNVVGNRYDSEITRSIKAAVAAMPGVLGAYDLVLHDYGPESAMGAIHVEIPAEITAAQMHKLTMDIQQMVAEQFHVFLTVGIYAVDTVDEAKKAAREQIRSTVTGFDGVVGCHGVFIDEEKQFVSFDAVVDFTVRNREALAEQIRQAVGALHPGCTVNVNFDTNYSD